MRNERRIKVNEYWAVYKGDEIITHGTLQQVAKVLDIDLEYARWMTAPSIRKRMSKGKNRTIFVPVPSEEGDSID